jgi:outer membrane protein assembly factor BamB
VEGTPAVGARLVFVGTTAGKVLALKVGTGRTESSVTLDAKILEPAVVLARGVVYACAWSGTLYAITASTGQVLWTMGGDLKCNEAPAVSGGVAYVPVGGLVDPGLHAVDALTGQPLWERSVGAVGFTPTVVGGSIYVVSASDSLYAIDRATHATVWRAGHIGSGLVAVADGLVLVHSSVGLHIAALDATTGTLLWTASGTNAGDISVANGVIYAGVGNALTAYAENGQILWSAGVGGYPLSEVSIAEGHVYVDGNVGGTDGILHAFAPAG